MAVCSPSVHQDERWRAHLLSTQMSGSVSPHCTRVSGSVLVFSPPRWAAVCSPSLHKDERQCAHPLATWMSGSVLTLLPPGERHCAHPFSTGVSRCVLNLPTWVSGTLPLTLFAILSGYVLTRVNNSVPRNVFPFISLFQWFHGIFYVGTIVAWKVPYHYNTTLHNNTSVPFRKIFQCYIYVHSKVSVHNI